jgi:homeobox-leucine zipper protein
LQGEPETGPVEMGTEKAKMRGGKGVPVSEVSVKAERVAPGSELAPKREEGGSRDTCSDSLSSEVLDADSPRTMDSAPPPLEKMISVSPAEVPVDSNIIHVSDHLCDQMLSPQACQRISVKLEDGSFQDESSCNYILSQLDEERGLPWWDWP